MLRRVLLIEDAPLIRGVIRRMIAPECEIVGEIEDGCEVVPRATLLTPDTVLLDISLPGMSGIALLPELRTLLPEATIIVLTSHAEPAYREEALRRGADAYILKADAGGELLSAIRRGRGLAPAS